MAAWYNGNLGIADPVNDASSRPSQLATFSVNAPNNSVVRPVLVPVSCLQANPGMTALRHAPSSNQLFYEDHKQMESTFSAGLNEAMLDFSSATPNRGSNEKMNYYSMFEQAGPFEPGVDLHSKVNLPPDLEPTPLPEAGIKSQAVFKECETAIRPGLITCPQYEGAAFGSLQRPQANNDSILQQQIFLAANLQHIPFPKSIEHLGQEMLNHLPHTLHSVSYPWQPAHTISDTTDLTIFHQGSSSTYQSVYDFSDTSSISAYPKADAVTNYAVSKKAASSASEEEPKYLVRRKQAKTNSRQDPDRPKRPLTAYNLFFQYERAKILGEELPFDIQLAKVNDAKCQHQSGASSAAKIGTDIECLRARKRSPKRKISFRDLARTVSSKWKAVDEHVKTQFQNLAARDSERYKIEKETYQRRKGMKANGQSGKKI